MIAVLFARADSIYKTFPECDVWDAIRDALRWPGGGPLIAHPPCRAWGELKHLAKPLPGERASTMPKDSAGHRIVENVARARAEGADHDNPFGSTRNKRSVWTVTTKACDEAHFATFPPDLIEPCILAGCPEGGIVLDPFGGAGTTGLVADRHQRNAILIELNPEYVEMARKRIFNDAPLFADVTA